MRVQNIIGLCIAIVMFILGHAKLISTEAKIDFSVVDKGLALLFFGLVLATFTIGREIRTHTRH